MPEIDCPQSPDGKHHYHMIKSGLNPLYGCKYCLKARPKTITCPHCGHTVETDEGNIWGKL